MEAVESVESVKTVVVQGSVLECDTPHCSTDPTSRAVKRLPVPAVSAQKAKKEDKVGRRWGAYTQVVRAQNFFFPPFLALFAGPVIT